MLILGIDTSCDDTGAAVVRDGHEVLSNVIASQHKAHDRFGGVVPVIAAREHTAKINFILESALEEAGVSFADLDAVAVSHHQGLLLALVVGSISCKINSTGLRHSFDWHPSPGRTYLFQPDGTLQRAQDFHFFASQLQEVTPSC